MGLHETYEGGLAGVALSDQEPRRAVHLLAAAQALLTAMKAGLYVDGRAVYERTEAAARLALGEIAFDKAFAQGQEMALEEAVKLALEG